MFNKFNLLYGLVWIRPPKNVMCEYLNVNVFLGFEWIRRKGGENGGGDTCLQSKFVPETGLIHLFS